MRNATKRSRLRIGNIQSEPAERLPYAVLPPSGHHPVDTWLPIYRGTVHGLPDEIDTLVIASLRRLLRHQPDILLLHPSPSIPEYGLQGEKTLCSLLEQNSPALICCGHTHWPTPWVQWNGASIINADGKIIILTRAGE
ncbi:metallophosphoesterase [Paenibacillus sp. OSY-SE]|uniref:metallophosphoesterase n=1 Tax=Paenibacillus sp. OSY-SE TaxID=1196323 RepID=UPI00030C97D7|nr:metallophosphoesterase family protein [Paenibacillus sp. OSY-SE]